MSATPRMLPSSVPSRIVMKEPRRPRNAPTMAIIFTSPKPMPSRPRTTLYKAAAAPEQQASEGGAEEGVEEPDGPFGERAVEERNVEEDRRCRHREERTRRKSGRATKPGPIDGVGENADAQIGDGEDDDQADEDEPLEGFDGEAETEVTGDEEQAGGRARSAGTLGRWGVRRSGIFREARASREWERCRRA